MGRNLFADGMPEESGRNLFPDQSPVRKSPGVLSQVMGAAPTLISGGLAEPFAGVAEVGAAAFTDASSEERKAVGQSVRDSMTIDPNEAGQVGLQNLGAFVEDVGNLPFVKMVIENFTESQDTLRNKALSMGASPEVAGLVASMPNILLEGGSVAAGTTPLRLGAEGVEQVVKNVPAALQLAQALPQKAAETALSATSKAVGVVGDVASNARPSVIRGKQEAREALLRGDVNDPVTAGYRLEGSKVVVDDVASEALRQGFPEEIVANIKAANPSTRRKMFRMADVRDRGLRGQIDTARERASDVVGESIGERMRFLRQVNRKAGNQIDKASDGLKGVAIDVSAASDSLLDTLDGMGVRFNRNDLTQALDFSESALAQLPALQGTVKRFVNTLANAGEVDAYKAHIFKRQIDNIVDYGKGSAKPITRDVENMLKDFRFKLNESIRAVSDDYAKANDTYSETVRAIGGVSDLLGKKYNPFESDEQLGTLSRRVLSNAVSRKAVQSAMDDLNGVARKYSGGNGPFPAIPGTAKGGRFQDDMMALVKFYDSLDTVIAPEAKTSLAGDFNKFRRNPSDVAFDVVSEELDAFSGVGPKAAIKSVKDLVRSK